MQAVEQSAYLREGSVVASEGGIHALDVYLWRNVAQHELHGMPKLLQGRQGRPQALTLLPYRHIISSHVEQVFVQQQSDTHLPHKHRVG
jgi:hypothetical protein